MNGLPPDLDLSFFENKTLIQVCVGFNELILVFEPRILVTVTSSIGYVHSHKRVDRFESFPVAASVVCQLLNRAVDSAAGTPDGTLRLEFSGGGHLELYDDSKQFESYVIRFGDTTIVV